MIFRLFFRALIYSVLWTIWMVGVFLFLNWIGWTSSHTGDLWHWLSVVGVMTIAMMVAHLLDERHAKKQDHNKRMRERGFE